jgi:hypothetical protein
VVWDGIVFCGRTVLQTARLLTAFQRRQTIGDRSNAMNPAIAIWLFFRALRWLAWIGFFSLVIYIMNYRPAVVTSFGHLQVQYEVGLMALANAAIFMGFFELMMREKARIPRPSVGELIPERSQPNRQGPNRR